MVRTHLGEDAPVDDVFLHPNLTPCYSAFGTGEALKQPLRYASKDPKNMALGEVVKGATVFAGNVYTVMRDEIWTDEEWPAPVLPKLVTYEDIT